MNVISVENLSKIYRLGQLGTGTFAHDLNVWWARTRGKPNPLLKIGETDHDDSDGEEIWALKDVSFTVEQGEALGIIGRNGAGAWIRYNELRADARQAASTDRERRIGMQLIIKYPKLLPDALQQTQEEFEREAKMAMAVKLFELRKLSSGMAAQLVGMDRVAFLLSLHRYGVSMIALDEAELEADLKNA